MRAQHGAAGFRKKTTLITMARRPFRLTFIDARRPYGVAGCDTYSRAPSLALRAKRRRGRHNPTEAGRAIHGCLREPHTRERGGNRLRPDRNILVLGFIDRAGWSQYR